MKRQKIEGGKILAKNAHPEQEVYFGENLEPYVVDKVDIEKPPFVEHVVTFKNTEEHVFVHELLYTDKRVFIEETIKDAEDKQKEEDIRWEQATIVHDSYSASLWLRINKFKKALDTINF